MQHIIFDLWGTLADTDRHLLCTPRGALLRWGERRWMREETPPETFFPAYAATHNIPLKDLQDSFRAMEQTMHWFPGIPELLKELYARRNPLHLLSNAGINTRDAIEKSPLAALFTTRTFSCEIGTTKPDVRAFKTVLEKAGAQPKQCIMVGDNLTQDIRPAQALGMRVVHFQGRRQSVDSLRDALEQLLKQNTYK